jgi:hypothetical protein
MDADGFNRRIKFLIPSSMAVTKAIFLADPLNLSGALKLSFYFPLFQSLVKTKLKLTALLYSENKTK